MDKTVITSLSTLVRLRTLVRLCTLVKLCTLVRLCSGNLIRFEETKTTVQSSVPASGCYISSLTDKSIPWTFNLPLTDKTPCLLLFLPDKKPIPESFNSPLQIKHLAYWFFFLKPLKDKTYSQVIYLTSDRKTLWLLIYFTLTDKNHCLLIYFTSDW